MDNPNDTAKYAVIFDLGGVMVRLVWHRAAFRRLALDARLSPEQAFEWFGRDGRAEALNRGTLTPAGLYQSAREAFNLTLDEAAFREAWTSIFEPMPGMAALFAEVSERAPVGILSDTDPWHWEKLRSILPPQIERVREPTLSFRENLVKPEAAIFHRAAQQVGRATADCVFIDDRAGNVAGAEAVGMTGILFTGAEALRERLRALKIL